MIVISLPRPFNLFQPFQSFQWFNGLTMSGLEAAALVQRVGQLRSGDFHVLTILKT